MARKKKTTMGKQKIEMKKLASEDARHVCFSKRKAGLFSKASELATLCGAEVGIVADSPAGCPYSFGSPSMNQVVDRFLSGPGPALLSGIGGAHEARRLSVVQELNRQCTELSELLDASKKRKAMLEERVSELTKVNKHAQRGENMGELDSGELKEMEKALLELRERLQFMIYGGFTEGASSSNTVTNPVIMQNMFEPGASQAGFMGANHFGVMNLSELGTNDQAGPSGTKVNPTPVVNPNEHEANLHPEATMDMGPGHGFY